MKNKIHPAVGVVAVVLLLGVLGYIGMKVMNPQKDVITPDSKTTMEIMQKHMGGSPGGGMPTMKPGGSATMQSGGPGAGLYRRDLNPDDLRRDAHARHDGHAAQQLAGAGIGGIVRRAVCRVVFGDRQPGARHAGPAVAASRQPAVSQCHAA